MPLQISLTNAAAMLLAQLAATPGLLTDSADLYRVGEFAENHLADLPAAPIQPDKNGQPQDWQSFNNSAKDWAKTQIEPIEIKERTREALKKLVKVGIEKGTVGATAPVVCLMRELGLSPDA